MSDEFAPSLSLKDEDMIKMIEYLKRYMSCFRIYGYDLNGHEVVIVEDSNPMEDRALEGLVSEHCEGVSDFRVLGEEEKYEDDDTNEDCG